MSGRSAGALITMAAWLGWGCSIDDRAVTLAPDAKDAGTGMDAPSAATSSGDDAFLGDAPPGPAPTGDMTMTDAGFDGGEVATGPDEKANWPMPNPAAAGLPHPHSYDTSAAGVVLDNVTGLSWQRDVLAMTYTWGAAAKPCAELVLGGQDDWRLPTVIELVSLLDFTRTNPALDAAAFPDAPSGFYWSSTPVVWNIGLAQSVAFRGAGATSDTTKGTPGYVRCVRGGPPVPASPRYVLRDSTAEDTRTKLTWQRGLAPQALGWEAAQSYCAALALEGGKWRVPSMKELHTILDYTRFGPATDNAIFNTGGSDRLWTSTPFANNPALAWAMLFYEGAPITYDITIPAQVRCVRVP